MKGIDIALVGFALVFLGMLLVLLGIASQAARGGADVRGGGVVMIGPIPIIFGSDVESAKAVILLAIALMIVALLALRWFR